MKGFEIAKELGVDVSMKLRRLPTIIAAITAPMEVPVAISFIIIFLFH